LIVLVGTYPKADYMKPVQKIVEVAGNLFDAVGITRLSGTDNLLILGLESTPERNLDEFGYLDGRFRMYGYEKYVKARLESILNFIRCAGFQAKPLGRLGYPLNGQLYLKGEALRAGMGKRGKNTIILHPKFGPRLRLIAVVTDALLVPPVEPVTGEEENPVCKDCSICIDACPEKILAPYRMIDPLRCLSDTDNMSKENDRLIPCDLCLTLCPACKKK
jgi:epoxyqueuosine reductase QueG